MAAPAFQPPAGPLADVPPPDPHTAQMRAPYGTSGFGEMLRYWAFASALIVGGATAFYVGLQHVADGAPLLDTTFWVGVALGPVVWGVRWALLKLHQDEYLTGAVPWYNRVLLSIFQRHYGVTHQTARDHTRRWNSPPKAERPVVINSPNSAPSAADADARARLDALQAQITRVLEWADAQQVQAAARARETTEHLDTADGAAYYNSPAEKLVERAYLGKPISSNALTVGTAKLMSDPEWRAATARLSRGGVLIKTNAGYRLAADLAGAASLADAHRLAVDWLTPSDTISPGDTGD